MKCLLAIFLLATVEIRRNSGYCIPPSHAAPSPCAGPAPVMVYILPSTPCAASAAPQPCAPSPAPCAGYSPPPINVPPPPTYVTIDPPPVYNAPSPCASPDLPSMFISQRSPCHARRSSVDTSPNAHHTYSDPISLHSTTSAMSGLPDSQPVYISLPARRVYSDPPPVYISHTTPYGERAPPKSWYSPPPSVSHTSPMYLSLPEFRVAPDPPPVFISNPYAERMIPSSNASPPIASSPSMYIPLTSQKSFSDPSMFVSRSAYSERTPPPPPCNCAINSPPATCLPPAPSVKPSPIYISFSDPGDTSGPPYLARSDPPSAATPFSTNFRPSLPCNAPCPTQGTGNQPVYVVNQNIVNKDVSIT